MDYKQLKDYIHERHEIRELSARLNQPLGSKEFYEHATILDYRKGYPQPRTIAGYDTETELAARERWRKRMKRLEARIREVENYIDNITDSRTRRCFTMYFLDGLKEAAIGKNLHIDQSMVSKIIREHLRKTGLS